MLLCGLSGGSDGQESTCNPGGLGSILGSGRSSGKGSGNRLQYSCLENLMGRGVWQSTLFLIFGSFSPLKIYQWAGKMTIYGNLKYYEILLNIKFLKIQFSNSCSNIMCQFKYLSPKLIYSLMHIFILDST